MDREERRLPHSFIYGIVCFLSLDRTKDEKKKCLRWIELLVGLDSWVEISLEQKLE